MAGAGEACAGSLEALNKFGRSVEGVDREAKGFEASLGADDDAVDGVKEGKLD